jgi:hypothetical protein
VACLDLAEDGEGLDGLVVVGDEIHHPVATLPQLLRVHRPKVTAVGAVAPVGAAITRPAPVPGRARRRR